MARDRHASRAGTGWLLRLAKCGDSYKLTTTKFTIHTTKFIDVKYC